MPRLITFILCLAISVLPGCPKQLPASTPVPVSSSEALLNFLDEFYDQELAKDPVGQHYQGITDNQDRWTLFDEEQRKESMENLNKTLVQMHEGFPIESLNEQGRLNYKLFEYRVARRADQYRWRHHRYTISQMHSVHAWIPSFLINVHRIGNETDARAYISRLNGVGDVIKLAMKDMERSMDMGILPPAFVFPMVLEDCRNLLSGAPFDDGPPSTWLADFSGKLDGLEGLDPKIRASLEQQAVTALLQVVQPAYLRLIERLTELSGKATTDDGVWKLPDGQAYYAHRLRMITTTQMTAQQIHELGVSEVARIHTEMKGIQKTVGFEGTLQEFFEHLRTDPKFFYPEGEEGRTQYLEHARKVIKEMENALPGSFYTLPKAPLQVKAVESYREKSAGKAFYSAGSPDGTRPGVYYANLYQMSSMPIYQLEALAYHEGVPGHHLQNSISRELTGIAKFRKFGGYTAYGEGWGLYSEYLPKELGFYADPYSDFGRLAMELWRACRLVVDTGIHEMRWTREEAITYLMENTPNPKRDAVKAIERYIVMPGQATGYKVGMNRILDLRQDAKERLGDDFDLRDFHEQVLTNGPVPLDILEQLIEDWIQSPGLPKAVQPIR